MTNNVQKQFRWFLKHGYDFIDEKTNNSRFLTTNYKMRKFLLKKYESPNIFLESDI